MISKTFVIATALLTALSAQAHAAGKKPTPIAAPADIRDKSAYFESQITQFNLENQDITLGREETHSKSCGKNPDMTDLAEKTFAQVCERIAVILPKDLTCAQVVEIKAVSKWASERVSSNVPYGLPSIFGDRYNCVPHGQLSLSLTEEGKRLVGSVQLFDQRNPDIAYNVKAMQKALSNLYMSGEDRKMLEGLFTSTAQFAVMLDGEADKAKRNEPALPYMHRTFVTQATLVTSYYKYLVRDLQRLSDFSSANSGDIRTNRDSVDVINKAATNISSSYGLDVDVNTQQIASFGRVFLDVLDRFNKGLTLNEQRTYTQPLATVMASKVMPIALAQGDLNAAYAVSEFRAIWETDGERLFFRDKLSSPDESLTHQIITLSNLAYKIGAAAGVQISAVTSRDAQTLRDRRDGTLAAPVAPQVPASFPAPSVVPGDFSPANNGAFPRR